MKGLALSEAYYREVGKPWLLKNFAEYKDRICAGLVGQGSECFGFDDELSRDHDFGPSFCLWLSEEDYRAVGKEMAEGYRALPGEFMGFSKRNISLHGDGRVGVLETKSFYQGMIGGTKAPDTLMDWLFLPEPYLAMATNGAVFEDPYGEFSAVRKKLLDFYPEDVRIKKIAARAATMAQSGQYNYARCLRRGEVVAAAFALDEFVRAGISMVYLLNRVYMPFYKWMHRGMEKLLILSDLKEEFQLLISVEDRRKERIEKICDRIKEELRRQGLTDGTDGFLENHVPCIMAKIQDPVIRCLPEMQG